MIFSGAGKQLGNMLYKDPLRVIPSLETRSDGSINDINVDISEPTILAILRGWFWGKKYFGIYSASELADEILKIIFAVLFLEGGILAS